MTDDIKYPIKCISYCASKYESYERINSYEFWVRGQLIVRIIADKPFARGDMIWLDSISFNEDENSYLIKIRVIDDEDYENNLPVLSLTTSRIIYSVDDFDIKEKNGVKLLKSIYVDTDDSKSLAFISLIYGDGSLKCKSKSLGAEFCLDFKTEWKV